jgi:hypothetical protein
MNVIARGALECSDVEARPAGSDPGQDCSCFALWTWWPVKRDHDAVPLHQAGAQNSQSPADAVMGGDGVTVEPTSSRRCSILLIFEKLTAANAQRHQAQ